MRTFVSGVGFLAFLLAIVAGRLADAPHVFSQAGIFLTDADCYARLQRALPVYEGKSAVIRHHDFENAPAGTTPHTTAPLDWLLAGLAGVVHLFRSGAGSVSALETAGALLPVLLGTATGGILWFWFRRFQGPVRWLGPVLFAASPALAWATMIGRPDHQALLLLLVAAALALEWPPDPTAQPGPSRERWELAAGICWGFALWVSLYEPLLLFLVRILGRASAPPGVFRNRGFLRGLAGTGGVLLAALALEGWRLGGMPADIQDCAVRWAATIGELTPVWRSPGAMLGAVGTGLLAAPILLARPAGFRARLLPALLLIATVALSLWQARWLPFLALAYAFSLPAQWGRTGWIGWLTPLMLWPMLHEWDRRLDHRETPAAGIARTELESLRHAAATVPTGEIFLAPWWLSPPVAWWAGARGVAGSSHESLRGIVDAARFFATADEAEAVRILESRGVAQVVVTDPGPVLENSGTILGRTVGPEAMGARLFHRPGHPPNFLRLRWSDGRVHVFDYAPPPSAGR